MTIVAFDVGPKMVHFIMRWYIIYVWGFSWRRGGRVESKFMQLEFKESEGEGRA